MEIHFVTGKGGVGKSSFAISLALKKAQLGHRTLLVEIGNESYFEVIFKLKNVAHSFKNLPLRINYVPQEIQWSSNSLRLHMALWNEIEALRDYTRYFFKIEKVVELIFENKISRALIDVAPGLKEISVLGKITSGVRHHGPDLKYDSIIVDSPATGHFLNLLRAPRSLSKALPRSPLSTQCSAIDQVLVDTMTTHYHIVCLPEEMPVQESIELNHELKTFGCKNIHSWLNKCVSLDLQYKEWFSVYEDLLQSEKPSGCLNYFHQYFSRQDLAVAKLVETFGHTTCLPWCLDENPANQFEQISKWIS